MTPERVPILAVIQARDGGTRLPGKIRADIGGSSMLAQVVHRVSLVGLPLVVAFPPPELKENDVLGRFARIARHNPHVDAFVRITADCPLLDPSVVGFSVNTYRSGVHDFVGTAPDMDGLDCEVFSRSALLACDLAAKGRAREHVTSWMRRNLAPYPIINWAPCPLRWSVDDESGLNFARRVYAACDYCKRAVPHHTNAGSSIGGQDRTLVVDLHQTEDGGLVECGAADILRERMGGPVYVSQ